MVLGMTLFLVFPFTRLVHVWSGLGTVAYLLRPYQLARSRRTDLGAGTPATPRQAPTVQEPRTAPAIPVHAKEAR
jgi:nitrate reductase gamma subunit